MNKIKTLLGGLAIASMGLLSGCSQVGESSKNVAETIATLEDPTERGLAYIACAILVSGHSIIQISRLSQRLMTRQEQMAEDK